MKMTNNQLIRGVFFLLLAFLALPAHAQRGAMARNLRTLDGKIRESPVFSQHFTGFALYDPETASMVYQKDAFKYYTPASNTKLFTLYTALKVLGDSMPVLRYGVRDQLMYVQGTGNPLFLHPDFLENRQGWEVLSQAKNLLLYSSDNYRDDHFGPGWSWADYQYAYQVEKSALPIYGNFVRFSRDSGQVAIQSSPAYFSPFLRPDPKQGNGGYPRIFREEHGAWFYHNRAALTGAPFLREVPFDQSDETVCALLEDTLGVRVMPAAEIPGPLPVFSTLYAPLPDTLLRRFMQESDNFLAEQLLLMCSEKLFGNLNTEAVIEYAKAQVLNGLPDTLNWADGSGLSRYNLFTPRTIVALLDRMYKEIPKERLFSILAVGGQSGTIRSWYAGSPDPYVFAKTGSLANQHCLSGYLLTKKGKTLIFSFMHNNFISPSSQVRAEMQRVLEWLRDTM